MKTVHIGIVTYNSRLDLPPCFTALHEQTYPRLTLTVFDNASQDESVLWLQAHEKNIQLILSPKNIGFARGHNQILQVCQPGSGDFYLALNPDVILMPDYIEILVSTLEAHNAGWGTGLLLCSPDEPLQIYSAGHAMRRDGYAFHISYQLPLAGDYRLSREVFGASGAACFIRQELIADLADQQYQLFDEQMFLYYEDTDLDWRARLQGWRCWYAADAVAYHRGSQPDLALKTQALGNRFLSIIKNAYLVDLIAYNLPLIILHCLFRLLTTPWHGIRLMAQVIRFTPVMIRKRRKPTVPRSEIIQWMRWSEQQPPANQYRLLSRLRRLLRSR